MMTNQEETLKQHGTYFNSLAIIQATLIENVNMQMEAETADLLDRRMMQLFGVVHNKLGKGDIKSANYNLNNRDDPTSPWNKMDTILESGAIPEVGLKAKTTST